MFKLVSFILTEQTRINVEITGRDVFVMFDGTTILAEAMAVVVHFVSDEWALEQCLLQLETLTKSMTGEEIAWELISVLSTCYSTGSNQLLAGLRDRASLNNVAMRAIKILYRHMLDVECFSHSFDQVGEHFTNLLLLFLVGSASLDIVPKLLCSRMNKLVVP